MGSLNQLAPFLLMFAVIYFFMIRPQVKKQKQEKKFAQELKVGDLVITKSGLHGKINEIKDNTCILETMAGKLKFDRSSLSMELSRKISKQKA